MLLSMGGKLMDSSLHFRLVIFPSLQLLLIFNLELLHFGGLVPQVVFDLLFYFGDYLKFLVGFLVFFLDRVEFSIKLVHIIRFDDGVFLEALIIVVDLFQLVLSISQVVAERSAFSFGCLSVTSPFLDLVSERRFSFYFLFLDVLHIVLQLKLIVFVLKLTLAIFLMFSSKQSFLLEIFTLEVVTELVDLTVKCVDHLIFAFDSILKLNLLTLSLMDFILLFLHL